MIAIVSNEKKEMYIYLLRCFEGFFGFIPISVFTDMDVALLAAIAEKWPQVYHLWCAMHIYRNLYKKHFFAL